MLKTLFQLNTVENWLKKLIIKTNFQICEFVENGIKVEFYLLLSSLIPVFRPI